MIWFIHIEKLLLENRSLLIGGIQIRILFRLQLKIAKEAHSLIREMIIGMT